MKNYNESNCNLMNPLQNKRISISQMVFLASTNHAAVWMSEAAMHVNGNHGLISNGFQYCRNLKYQLIHCIYGLYTQNALDYTVFCLHEMH